MYSVDDGSVALPNLRVFGEHTQKALHLLNAIRSLREVLSWQTLQEQQRLCSDEVWNSLVLLLNKTDCFSTLPLLLNMFSTTSHSSTMSQTSSLGTSDACILGKGAIESGLTQKSIRIVGMFNLYILHLQRAHTCIPGISVGQVEPDKKPLYFKLKLNGTRFGRLPPIDAKATPGRRNWTFIL